MKNFLKKYVTEEQLGELEKAYAEKNPESKGLPVYISKERLDEVLGQKKTVEDALAAKTKEFETYVGGEEAKIKGKVDEALTAAQTESQKTIEGLNRTIELNQSIYGLRGKNVVAISALVDASKPVADELTRISKECPYLFYQENEFPDGTGKGRAGDDKTDKGITSEMRAAVGL